MRKKRPSVMRAAGIGACLAALIGLLGWDIIAAIQNDALAPRQIVYLIAWHRPTLAFVVGLLAGHFLWPLHIRHRSLALYLVSASFFVCALLWLEYLAYIPRPVWLMPITPFLVGILAGHWLWTATDPLDWREL
jgi:hypothetical protein